MRKFLILFFSCEDEGRLVDTRYARPLKTDAMVPPIATGSAFMPKEIELRKFEVVENSQMGLRLNAIFTLVHTLAMDL